MVFMLPGPVERALDRLHAAGFSAYVVGGCVRDWVLGVAPHDYDICTAARPEDMQRIFQGERTIETGLRHGTLTVLLDGMPLEITTFRLDGEYLDGRHPASVRFTGRVEDDLSRRDFTINAMAYAPAAGLVDPFGGREDCRRGVIRCVGEAEKRFAEDALRILRALRFSARLRFPIAPETDAALRAGRTQLERISRERIAAELTGLLLGDGAGGVLMAYPEVIRTVLPELSALTAGPAWARTLRRVDAKGGEPSLGGLPDGRRGGRPILRPPGPGYAAGAENVRQNDGRGFRAGPLAGRGAPDRGYAGNADAAGAGKAGPVDPFEGSGPDRPGRAPGGGSGGGGRAAGGSAAAAAGKRLLYPGPAGRKR